MKVNEMKKTDYEITLELTLSYSELNDHFVYCEWVAFFACCFCPKF